MGIRDRLKDLTGKAKDSAAEHKQQVEQTLEKAALAADQRTGGKYHDQIAKAETRAEEYVQKLETPARADQDQDTSRTEPAGGEHPPG